MNGRLQFDSTMMRYISSEFLGRPNARLRCVRTESTVRPADDTDVAMRARGLSQGYRRAAAGARLLAG